MFGLATVTETQRDALSPQVGDTIFNTDAQESQSYNGAGWSSVSALRINDGMRTFIRGAVPVNTIIVFNKISIPTTYEVGIATSQFHCLTPPTDTVVVDIIKTSAPYSTDVNIGTLTWTVGASVPTVSFTSLIPLAITDIIKIVTPADTYGIKDMYIDLIGHTLMPIYG